MSAALRVHDVPLPPADAPAKAAGVARQGWIDLQTAATRSGISMGQIARRCREAWCGDGLARLEAGEDGIRRWRVRVDAHPKFAPPAAQPDDDAMIDVPQAKRDEAYRRRDILARWRARLAQGYTAGRGERAITAAFLADLSQTGASVSRGTLYRWDRLQHRHGIRGLVDQRGVTAAEKLADPFIECVKSLYLTTNRLRLSVCHQMATHQAMERGWQVPSMRTVRRAMAAIPLGTRIMLREGRKAFTDQAEPFHVRDYSTLASNEQWVGDHHDFDVFVRVEDHRTGKVRHVRPTLTGWMDMRSRKLVGFAIQGHTGNSDTILAAFTVAALEHGLPKMVYIDNGRDYGAQALMGSTKRQRQARRGTYWASEQEAQGLFGRLGITARFCQKYHGQSKPIERFFLEVEERFGKLWPTYCGHTTASKPQELKDRLDGGEAPTLDEFSGAFARWLQADYHTRSHFGDAMGGRPPEQVWKEELSTLRTTSREALALALHRRVGPRKVAQNGVTWGCLSYGQYEPWRSQWLGKWVWLRRSDADLSHVTVWDEHDRFIGAAPCNVKLPANADSQTIRQAQQIKRRAARVERQYLETGLVARASLPELMARAAEVINKPSRPTPDDPRGGPTIQPVRTAFDDQLPAIRHAMARLAAGAESMADRPSASPERLAWHALAVEEGGGTAVPDECGLDIITCLRTTEGVDDD
jgi:putative transposase